LSVDALLAHSGILAARAYLERTDEVTLARQVELSRLPAPTGAEARRGARVAELFREIGLRNVLIDEVGNVHGWLGEKGMENGERAVVLCAHLDTVFGPDVDVAVRRQGGNEEGGGGGRLEGPGISDNARGLAALVAVAEALGQARVAASRPVLFAATVGEEGSGDLRGVKHLFARDGLRPAAVIALDGAGMERIVHRALGSKRYRVTYRGPGGHSWAAFGVANPATAVGRAASLLADLPALPPPPPHPPPGSATAEPRTTCAVVRLGGGTGLNSIPQQAWLDLDLRSEDAHALSQLDAAVAAVLARARDEENRRRTPGTPALTLERQLLGARPSGSTPRSHPLVQAAIAANTALGKTHELACASTDANVPIALGVPAIALGAGGKAGDTHLTTEWYENSEGALGLVRALLVVAAMAEVQ
jgi:acetylornithine deacetylase/succinyl-diaminopimelate desuccinylase-like protein